MHRYLIACALVTSLLCASASAARPLWEERHGLTADDFEKTTKQLAERGYRPVQISAAVVGKELRFAAIWEKHADAPPTETRHNLTDKQYEKTADELKEKGFRPVEVRGYEVDGEARFAAIWEKAPKDAPAREAHHALTSDDYRKVYAELTKKGYRPLQVSGYAIGKETRYATIWEKEPKNAPAWHTRRDLTAEQYQDVFDEQLKMGHRIVHVSGYTIDGQERFAGVWEAATTGWYGHHGLDTKQFDAAMAKLKGQGLRPVQVSIYAVGGQARYAGAWVND